jgi:hypothetical protein
MGQIDIERETRASLFSKRLKKDVLPVPLYRLFEEYVRVRL